MELGPGSRRAELGSWSSQEHLEVGEWHKPVAGALGGDFQVRGREGGEMPEGPEPELQPKPSRLFSPSIAGSQRSLWGLQLVGEVGRRWAHRCSAVTRSLLYTCFWFNSRNNSAGALPLSCPICRLGRFQEAGRGVEGSRAGGQAARPHPRACPCPQWEPACQTPQPSARAHSAPGSGTTSRPGSIRRRLQPSGEPLGREWVGG